MIGEATAADTRARLGTTGKDLLRPLAPSRRLGLRGNLRHVQYWEDGGGAKGDGIESKQQVTPKGRQSGKRV